MAKSLVIVESPAKARTINRLLGKKFKVMASIGHIKDLPKSKLGVNVESDFEPDYVTIRGKGKVITELKRAAKAADNIYLASDPDREGEAIAYHIASEVDGKGEKVKRVLFNEITEKAVKEAIDNPVKLDTDKFEAQQARRILDRLVGYQVSPILWDKVRRGLSAGRVQSVALRLVCERERAIQAFVPVEYWSIGALFLDPDFEARLIKKDGKKLEISTGDEAASIKDDLLKSAYKVEKVEKKERKRNPTAPFTTSKLQQEASRKLSYTAKKTMMIAQQLYEGVEMGDKGPVGLITYMRTDSTRVSETSIAAARAHIESAYGPDFLPPKPNFYKSKKGAQDAHEAVRPTNMSYTPDQVKGQLSKDQLKLYTLIWNRFIASQMSPALLDRTKIIINAGPYELNATGTVVRFKGFTIVYEESTDSAVEKEAILPAITEGTELTLSEINDRQHFTQPPPRFSEATLVKELEENGIGRPSTYASILSTIQDREYAVKEARNFAPTELGFLVTDLLVENFPEIFNVAFTAKMEDELDQIEVGKTGWRGAMKDFYGPFSKNLEKAKKEMKNIKAAEEATDIDCDKCGKKMVIKWGRNGKFLACPGYPDCKNTKDFKLTEDGKVEPVEPSTEDVGPCPNCSKPMIVKSGRFGRFIACSDYPACKTTKTITTGIKCKNEGCDGELTEKRTKKGRTFFSCSNYPKCDYATWKLPKKGETEEAGEEEDS